MRVFFRKMGIENLRFKPAYNPYTEVRPSTLQPLIPRLQSCPSLPPTTPQPSLEVFAFHPLLNKWVEIGNSGMFRPELVKPTGVPDDVHVLGWGISLERPTMIKSVPLSTFP